MSLLWRLTRALTRPTNMVMRRLAGSRPLPAWGVVRVRGRRTGRERQTPVQMRELDGDILISLPWGERTEWLRNVLAAGGCTVRWRGTEIPCVEPRVVGWGEGSRAFGPFVRPVLWLIRTRRFLRLRRAGSPPRER